MCQEESFGRGARICQLGLQVYEVGCDIAVIFEEGFEVLLMGRVGVMLTRESGDEGWVLENGLQIDGSLPLLGDLTSE